VTEIYDYLRLLYARVGIPYSPATGLPIESQTVTQMVDRIMSMKEGTRLYLLAPIVRGRKGEYRKELQDLQKRGFQRVKVDGKLYDIGEVPALNKKLKHDIDDRGRPHRGAPGSRQPPCRIRWRQRLPLGEGLVFAEDADTGERTTFSSKVRLPGVRLHHRRDRAAAVLVQQPLRRLPGLRRARHQDVFRPRADRAGRPAGSAPGRDRALGQFDSSKYYDQTLDSLAKHFKVSSRDRLARSAGEGAARRSCTAPSSRCR
jgi:excinuclease ABC subunit A